MLQRAWHELHLVLLRISLIKSHSGSGSGFVSKFSFLCSFVNFTPTDMYDTSNERCAQELYFFFLYLRALSSLWGRYDHKTEKCWFLFVTLSISSHIIQWNTSSYRPSSVGSFSFDTPMMWEQLLRILWQKEPIKNWWFNCPQYLLFCPWSEVAFKMPSC